METTTETKGLEETDRPAAQENAQADVRRRLDGIARALAKKPFRPHPLFRNGHAQTLAAYAWPRRRGHWRAHLADEARLFEVEPGVRLLAHCRWQQDRASHPTIVLVHGLEGSSASIYILGTSRAAYQAGFNVIRLNLRNCGDTEHLTPTLYHSGMSGDVRAVIVELIESDDLTHIFLAGFSMGGNMVLKFAGESGEGAPRELLGACAVSPALNLSACAEHAERPSNWIYQQSFIRSLRRRMRHKKRLYPTLYDISELHRVRTVRDFDERYTALHGGFQSAADYYERSSALQFVPQIRVPTLIIQAQDDPLVPFDSFDHTSLANNPHIILMTPPQGGHVAFISAAAKDEDRFWAENRVVEFCRLVLNGDGKP